MSEDVEREIGEPAYGRRAFLRRIAVGTAFAVPVVSSFSMAGLSAVAQANQSNGPTVSTCNSNTTIVTSDSGTIGNRNSSEGPFGLFELWEEIIRLFGRGRGCK